MDHRVLGGVQAPRGRRLRRPHLPGHALQLSTQRSVEAAHGLLRRGRRRVEGVTCSRRGVRRRVVHDLDVGLAVDLLTDLLQPRLHAACMCPLPAHRAPVRCKASARHHVPKPTQAVEAHTTKHYDTITTMCGYPVTRMLHHRIFARRKPITGLPHHAGCQCRHAYCLLYERCPSRPNETPGFHAADTSMAVVCTGDCATAAPAGGRRPAWSALTPRPAPQPPPPARRSSEPRQG